MTPKNENIRRSERAGEALQSYEPKCPKAYLSEEVVVDLLCDMMHWARKNGADFAKACELAKASFEAEVAEEAGQPMNTFTPDLYEIVRLLAQREDADDPLIKDAVALVTKIEGGDSQ